MNCQEFLRLLDSYETLDADQLEKLNAHADECEKCREELTFFKSIIETSASVPYPAPPKSLIDDVNAALDELPSAPAVRGGFIGGVRKNVKAYATLAACLVVGVAVGVNSGYIKDNLDRDNSDGVIEESVTTAESDNDVESNGVTTGEYSDGISDNNPENAVSRKVEKDSSADEVPASSTEMRETSQENSNIDEVTTPRNNTASVPAVTATPVSETKETGKTDTKKETYTIAQNGYQIPRTRAVEPIAEPTAEPDVSSYSIADMSRSGNNGYYSVALNDDTKAVVTDYIFVGGKDMGAVVSIMSEMGVTGSRGNYVTTRADFYRLIDRFNSEGIECAYELNYDSGEEVTFQLRYN